MCNQLFFALNKRDYLQEKAAKLRQEAIEAGENGRMLEDMDESELAAIESTEKIEVFLQKVKIELVATTIMEMTRNLSYI